MSTKFKAVFEGLHGALKEGGADPVVTFTARSRQIGGLRSEVQTRDFTFNVDEPEVLGGENTAPNPVEYILAGLASCQEITYRLYADRLGIPLDSVAVTVSGDIDLRGFFAVDEAVRPGYQNLKVEVEFESEASDEDLLRLKEEVDRHCPVLDIVTQPTPATLVWRRPGQTAIAAE